MNNREFPAVGETAENLLKQLEDRKKNDLQWQSGKAFSYVYFADGMITETLKKAYTLYFSENALNPSAFPSLRSMEIEVVDRCLGLFEAQEEAVGSMTSGGTESILMALKSAKEYAKVHKPHIEKPEVVFPLSAHPAFNKGCDYFGLEPKITAINEDYTANLQALEAAITENTILVVGSAPSYPQGVVDPITEIGQIAIKHNLLFHVDACVGGFVLPFIQNFEKAWNLCVPGVTSLSADIHKYGFASKGASVILYNNPDLRKAQFYVYTDWPGGMYGSPAILGTKPGGAIAVAWTVLHLLGRSGYEKLVNGSMETSRKFRDLINSMEGLEVFGQPDMCIYSFGSDQFDIYDLGDEMHMLGWLMDRQQNPPALHMSISPVHAKVFEEFEKDLRTCVQKVKRWNVASLKKQAQLTANRGLKKLLPEKMYKKLQDKVLESTDVDNKRSAAMYGLIGDLKGTGETDDLIRNFLDKMMK